MSDLAPGPDLGAAVWLAAVRRSHDRLAQRLSTLTEVDATRPSYAQEWTVADVASHLGSQAEIFELFLRAGVSEEPAPGGEVVGPIWDRWDALEPLAQVRAGVEADESFVAAAEQLSEPAAERFRLSMLGTELDLAALLALRLAEHAVHSWDVEVAFDPGASIAPDAVELLVGALPGRVERAGTPQPDVGPLVVETTDPTHRWLLTTHPAVGLTPAEQNGAEPVRLPAEAFLLLTNGRLDPERSPDGVDPTRLAALRTVFRGF